MKGFITIKILNHLPFKSVTDLFSCEIVIQIKKMETILEKSSKSNFRKKPRLDTHILSEHEEKNMFGCEICGKNFATKQLLARHIGAIHEGKKPYKCDICDYSCFQKSDLKRHLESVHDKKKTFKCARKNT